MYVVENRNEIINDIIDELVLKDIINLHDYSLVDAKNFTYAILSRVLSDYIFIDGKSL